ncbi:MAG TPA: VOC family protein [Longimicrobiales bacterium]|nr:VOC family protein [Longimicrobiales bacterium]
MVTISDATVTLMVQDLDRSVEFYRDMLGFAVSFGGPHFRMLEGASLKLGLHSGRARPGVGVRDPSLSIGLRVDDIQTAVAELEAQGVRFPEGIIDDDGAIQRAPFVDPDGTALYLLEVGGG